MVVPFCPPKANQIGPQKTSDTLARKEELGTKRICRECGTKFYDLNRNPIVCPKCEAVYEIKTDIAPPVEVKKTKPEPKETEAPPKEETAAEVAEEAEDKVVSLEEADEETTDARGARAAALDEDDIDLEDDDVEMEESDIDIDTGDVDLGDDEAESDQLLEQDDEFEDDMSDIIDTDIGKED